MKCDQDSPWRIQIASEISSTYARVKIFSATRRLLNTV